MVTADTPVNSGSGVFRAIFTVKYVFTAGTRVAANSRERNAAYGDR